jgi:hypothetical protein
MVHIEYSGISPESIDLINSDQLRSVLTAYPNLRLVTVDEDEDDDNEVYNEVALPLSEDHDACVAVLDKDDDDAFMWILDDDYQMVTDPSPAFIEVLRVMDDFSKRTIDERLFMTQHEDLYVDSPTILAAEFDFSTGDYLI